MATRAQAAEEKEESCKVYSGPVLSRRRRVALVRRSFTKTPRGSNSTETEFSVVNLRIERRWNRPRMEEYPVPITGRAAPLSRMMEEGKPEEEGVTILGWEVMWDEVPESSTQSADGGGGVRETVLKALARVEGSHDDGADGAW
jgi:hypothetical protein